MKKLSSETGAQLARIVEELLGGPKTTPELRDKLAVFGVAARISDLRRKGYKITTTLVDLFYNGVFHRNVARYTLIALPEQ